MPQVINTVTKASPTDDYAVVRDTDLSGGYRIVATISERDAIVPSQRKQSMLVFVIADLHFYQLQPGLSTWTDLGLSLGGGFAPPIVSYVYLVNDASDVSRMGGASNNVYNTFQDAYDAANTLQLALGGNNYVIIEVGNTISSVVGDVVLTSDWNNYVALNGINNIISVVGSIIGNNNAGDGFNIGFPNPITLTNVQIVNMTVNATGATGNSGTIFFGGYNVVVSSIDTSITNPLNTTGNGGEVQFINNGKNGIIVDGIITSSQDPNSSAGLVYIDSPNCRFGSITTANNNNGGSIFVDGHGSTFVGIISCISSSSAGEIQTDIRNIGCYQCDITLVENLTALDSINSCIVDVLTLKNIGGGTTTFTVDNCRIGAGGAYTSNANLKTISFNTDFTSIIALGIGSELYNCSIRDRINGISANCIISDSTIKGTTNSITNGSTPVSVLLPNTFLAKPPTNVVSVNFAIINYSKILPPALSGNINNYSPTGLGTTSRIFVTSTGSFAITGLNAIGMLDGQTIRLVNGNAIGSGLNITISHESLLSLTNNRFLCSGNVDRVLTPGSFIVLEYSITMLRWCTQL